jgi:hypothetical protein
MQSRLIAINLTVDSMGFEVSTAIKSKLFFFLSTLCSRTGEHEIFTLVGDCIVLFGTLVLKYQITLCHTPGDHNLNLMYSQTNSI